jgi:hypothetical protein
MVALELPRKGNSNLNKTSKKYRQETGLQARVVYRIPIRLQNVSKVTFCDGQRKHCKAVRKEKVPPSYAAPAMNV